MSCRLNSLGLLPALLSIAITATAAELPTSKQTTLGLYLSAEEAYSLRQQNNQALFIDIRSLAEITFLGMPTIADANIEYQRMDSQSRFNEKRGSFSLSTNPNFATEVKQLVEHRGLSKTDPVILMCRSGGRSAKAADELATLGFTRVYSITDGYEGDKVRGGRLAGQRVINGWKNAGLPWSYKLELSKLHGVPAAGHN